MRYVLIGVAFFFFITGAVGCDWHIGIVKNGLFAAFNYRTKTYKVFSLDSFPDNTKDKVYEGAMFNILLDMSGNIIEIRFCESKYV